MNRNDRIIRKKPRRIQPPSKKRPIRNNKQSSNSVETFIADRMKNLLSDFQSKPDNFKCSFNIITEKPVYTPGEKICITVVLSNKQNQKALSRKQMDTMAVMSSLKIVIKDANDGKVSDLKKELDKKSGMIYSEFLTKDNFKGGFYSVEIFSDNHRLDKTKFYVTSVREKRNAVVIDLNKDTLSTNDAVVGKVTLKMLTKSDEYFLKGAPGESLNYTVTVCNQDMEPLESFKRILSGGEGVFQFCTPEDLTQISAIVFLVEVLIEGEKLECSRQLSTTSLTDLHIKMVPSSGKFVIGFENEICFGCFADPKEKMEMALNYADLLELNMDGGMEKVVLKGISSDDTGRGKFKFLLKKKMVYQLEVQEGHLRKRFNLLTRQDLEVKFDKKMAQVLLEVNSRVFTSDQTISLSVKKQKHLISGEFRVTLMNKMTCLFERELLFEKGEEKLRMDIEVEELKFAVGGVVSAQLYKSSNTKVILQEYLMFIVPKKKLKLGITFDQERYTPGDQVNFKIKTEKANSVIGVVVSDETPFLEVERRRLPVSLCSKVFLEKELWFKGEEFPDSSQYIDWFFENNQQVVQQLLGANKSNNLANNFSDFIEQKKEKLGTLLGIQNWRLFFLDEENLGNFVKNPGTKPVVANMRNLLPVSADKLKDKMFPKPVYRNRARGRSKIILVNWLLLKFTFIIYF